MPHVTATRKPPITGSHALAIRLYPALRALPPEDRPAALRRARDTDFDTVEWIGVVGGTALVAGLLGSELPLLASEPALLAHVLRFFLALPLLAVVVGPMHLRRTRRGLAREIAAATAGPTLNPLTGSGHPEA